MQILQCFYIPQGVLLKCLLKLKMSFLSVTSLKCTKLSPFPLSKELLGDTECSGMGKRIREKTLQLISEAETV